MNKNYFGLTATFVTIRTSMAFGSVPLTHDPVGTQMHVFPVVASGVATATVVAATVVAASVGNGGNVIVVAAIVVAACLPKTIVIHEYTVG